MASLVDIARSMEKEKEKSSQPAPLDNGVAPKAQLTLVDVAKEQQQRPVATAPGKPLTLMDVARTVDVSRTAPTTAVSLQSLAQDINKEERDRVDAAITKAATEVKSEKAQQRASVLQAAATEVRQEELARQPVAKKKSNDPEPSLTVKASVPVASYVAVPSMESDDDGDGYSSFEDDERDTKKKKKQSHVPEKKIQNEEEEDNQSSSTGSDSELEKTTPSESPQASEFFRAIYRGDLRRVKDMMSRDDMDANTADQHGWSALHWAASQCQTETLDHLLAKEPRVDAVEHVNGWTALHLAVVREALPCVKKLLQAGAKIQVRDQYGDTVYDIAKSIKGKKKERMLQLFAEYKESNQQKRND